MKNISIICGLFFLTLIFLIDNCLTEFFRWSIGTVISLFVSTFFKTVLSLTGTVGSGFTALVDVCAFHPYIWKSVSTQFLSSPSQVLYLPCPPGFLAAPNASHYPSSNGCGAGNLKIDTRYLPYDNHEECCNAHDICYDQCHIISAMDLNLHRTQCDLKFKTCLDWVCTVKSWQRSFKCSFSLFMTNSFWREHCEPLLQEELEKKCRASVEVLYSSVNSWGSEAYLKAQEQACVCVPDEAKHE